MCCTSFSSRGTFVHMGQPRGNTVLHDVTTTVGKSKLWPTSHSESTLNVHHTIQQVKRNNIDKSSLEQTGHRLCMRPGPVAYTACGWNAAESALNTIRSFVLGNSVWPDSDRCVTPPVFMLTTGDSLKASNFAL